MASSKQLQRLLPWHGQLIDWLLTNPQKSGQEAAEKFGMSSVWISIVKNSPVFSAELERRREKISRSVEFDIAARAAPVANSALDLLSDRLQREGKEKMTLGELCETAEMALKMLGYPRRQISK